MDGLSVVIITFNEEENIECCIKSVADLCSDIVVVDSGSIDKTLEICAAYNCRVFYRPFDNYSAQKNYANSLAENDFILSLDADECLSDELKNSIAKIETLSPNLLFSFNRLNHYCGKPIKRCGWYPDVKIRIFNRNFARWVGSIHEEIVPDIKVQNIHLKGDLLHYSYKSIEEHVRQAEKFAQLNAESDIIKGRKSGFLKPFISSFFRFLIIYFFKFGFLDGKLGFLIAKISARATFLRYKELFNKNKKKI